MAVERSLFWSKFWIRTRLAGLFPSVRKLVDTETDALRFYSDRVLSAPVERMLDAALFPQPMGSQVIDLNMAAPRFEMATSMNRVFMDRAGQPPARGLKELREAVAQDALRREGVAIDAREEVLVTHGATGALTTAIDAFLNPDERVVVFDPCSPLFAMAASARRVRVTWVPTWTEAGRCRFHPKALQQALRGAKMVLFSDPANPTGACFAREDLELLASVAAKFDVLIYRDDSHGRFRFEGESTAMEAIPTAKNRTLTASSATSLGLASARVGWLRGPRGLINGCTVAANLGAPFVPAVCQQLAARAIRETDEQAFAPVREPLQQRRQFAFDRLEAMGLEPEWPAGGCYLQVSVAHLGVTARQFAERLYQERQVLVGPGDLYSPRGDGHVRISFAIEDGRLREGLNRLEAHLEREPIEPAIAAEPEERKEPHVEFRDVQRPTFSRS